MIVDFQHHFTPPELVGLPVVKNMSINKGGSTPPYRMPAELTDITAHVRDMDAAGIDHAVLSCGLGMDGTTLEVCRSVNDAMAQWCAQSPKRFSTFAHTDPLGGQDALKELERCRHDLGMQGTVIVSEPGGMTLDDPRLDPYWAQCERLGMFVFVHPSLRPNVGATMNRYDLIRSLGREFSLAMSTVRLINGGVLDRFEGLRVQMGHLAGGLAVSMNRVRALQDKERMGTVGHPEHGVLPRHDFDHYLRERLWFDTAGVFGSMSAVRAAVEEFTPRRVVFGTDYPLEILSASDLSVFVAEIRALGATGSAILAGNAKIFSARIDGREGREVNFRVTLQPSGHSFEVPEGKTVLAAGLDAGWNLPYSCRAGTCRTCRGRVVSGSVDYAGAHSVNLDDAARQKGDALLCQAKPCSDLVVEVQELSLHGAPPKLMPARVKRIEKPAPDVAILSLRLPMNENLMFAAGQFVDVLLAGGKTRSYSIANPPADRGVIDIDLHVRHLQGGLFTDRVFAGLKEGEILRLRAPLGTFYLREDSEKPIILLASGTGFAPIQSIILYAQRKGLRRPMKLYWGNRTPADFYARPPAGVDCVRVVSDVPWEGRSGFVHRVVMDDHPDLSGFQVYACGAPPMVDAARRDFAAQCGLPEGEFFADSFLTEGDIK